ncbi:MAG: HD domain-containing protein [Pseudonocardiaceae bacterium]
MIAGVEIPDTSLVREATELVRDTSTELLFHHSRRVYLFGTLQGLHGDLELLYVGAMFHDLGLVEPYRRDDQRFEVDGADEARRFLLVHGIDEARATRVSLGIALHATPGIPSHLDAEIALVSAGVDTDVLGIGYDDLDPELVCQVTDAHPRKNFKNGILAAFTAGMKDRPETTFGTMNDDVLAHHVPGFVRSDFVDVIHNSPWPD